MWGAGGYHSRTHLCATHRTRARTFRAKHGGESIRGKWGHIRLLGSRRISLGRHVEELIMSMVIVILFVLARPCLHTKKRTVQLRLLKVVCFCGEIPANFQVCLTPSTQSFVLEHHLS